MTILCVPPCAWPVPRTPDADDGATGADTALLGRSLAEMRIEAAARDAARVLGRLNRLAHDPAYAAAVTPALHRAIAAAGDTSAALRACAQETRALTARKEIAA